MTTATHRTRTSARLAAFVITVAIALAACGSDNQSSAPRLDDPAATAKSLVTNWLEVLKAGDLEAIADAMAPSFQIQRADGSSADRAAYLADPAVVSSYVIGDQIVATQSGDTLTVRWSLKVTETLDDVTYTDVEAPRLVAFEWQDGAWRIISYANFNPPSAAD